MVEVVNRSSEAVKRGLVAGKGLPILGDWLMDATATGAAGLCREQQTRCLGTSLWIES